VSVTIAPRGIWAHDPAYLDRTTVVRTAAFRRPHPASGAELERVIQAERDGLPFLLWRDSVGSLELRVLPGDGRRVTVGRRPENDLCLSWDEEVSRVHAEFEPIGGEWTVSDDGLSKNGTYLNASRIGTRRRLTDGDVMRFGGTLVVFRLPRDPTIIGTAEAHERPAAESLSPMQRRILVALCRPYGQGKEFASPATNIQIAKEVHLSVDAVKAHLRVLFAKLEVGDLPQNQKRLRVVERAFDWGLVSYRDLIAPDGPQSR
jgi:hypothetical protein